MDGKRLTNESLVRAPSYAHIVYLGLLPTADLLAALRLRPPDAVSALPRGRGGGGQPLPRRDPQHTPRPRSVGVALLVLLSFGAAQGALTHYRPYERDSLVRDSDASAVCIVVFIFTWLAALIAGNVLHEVSGRR